MKQSDTIAKLANALAKAQSEMGGAVKDSSNPFFKSKYADLGSVVKAIKEPFGNNGLTYAQLPCSGDNSLGVFCVGVATRLMHVSGEWLEGEFLLPLVKQDPQAAGAAITYARRYALMSVAGIPAADDDAESAMFRTAEPVPMHTDEDLAEFKRLLAAKDGAGFIVFFNAIGEDARDSLFNSAPKGEKTKLKDACRQVVQLANTSRKAAVAAIEQGILDNSITAIDEVLSECNANEAALVQAALTEIQQIQIQNLREEQ